MMQTTGDQSNTVVSPPRDYSKILYALKPSLFTVSICHCDGAFYSMVNRVHVTRLFYNYNPFVNNPDLLTNQYLAFGENVCLIPSRGFGFSLTNPVMGGFQGTSITALPSATDEGWNFQKRPYKHIG